MKKMISVMYAERAKAVASEGRATHGTEAGADISGWRQSDEMAAARRDGGSQTRWRQGQKKSEILLFGKISDSFDSLGGEQPRRAVSAICEESDR